MTKVSVIEIDLGTDIDEIITENVNELTGAAKKELDTAIEVAQQRDTLREKKSTEKNQADAALMGVMLKAYDQLAKAGAEGVLCDDIIDIVSEYVPNSSAFTLRMKKVLRDKENPYSLGRKKKNKKNYYIFSPYNDENGGLARLGIATT